MHKTIKETNVKWERLSFLGASLLRQDRKSGLKANCFQDVERDQIEVLKGRFRKDSWIAKLLLINVEHCLEIDFEFSKNMISPNYLLKIFPKKVADIFKEKTDLISLKQCQ